MNIFTNIILPKFIFIVFWVCYSWRGFNILISKSSVLNKSKSLGNTVTHFTSAIWKGFFLQYLRSTWCKIVSAEQKFLMTWQLPKRKCFATNPFSYSLVMWTNIKLVVQITVCVCVFFFFLHHMKLPNLNRQLLIIHFLEIKEKKRRW